MNTEHTNQPRQAATAAFEQWWQRHGLEDPMDDEDRQYATANSWARRGYMAAAQQLELERGTLLAETERKQQLQGQIEQLLNLVKSFGHKAGCAKNAFGEQCTCGADEAIAAAAQAQAEPVELRSVFDEMFDYSVDPTDDISREWLWRFSKGLVGRLSSKQPAVAVPGAVDLLREMEWENNRFADACPVCASSREQGHTANCKLAAVLAAAPQAASESPVQWPQERDVGRIGDMSQVASLRVGLDADNDVYVCIHGEAGSGSVEFCVPGSGGGKSPRTRAALISLMVAMEADNAETPSRDWWKAREGDEQKGGDA